MVAIGLSERLSHPPAATGALLDPTRLIQSFISRIQRHVSQLQGMALAITDFRLSGRKQRGVVPDRFGLRKVVVVDTSGEPCLAYRQLMLAGLQEKEGDATRSSLQLWRVAGKCKGLSGRSIRKISFLALALFSSASDRGSISLSEFLVSLDKAVDRQIRDREELTKDVSEMKLE